MISRLKKEDFQTVQAYIGAQLNEIAIKLDDTLDLFTPLASSEIEEIHDLICELRNLVYTIK